MTKPSTARRNLHLQPETNTLLQRPARSPAPKTSPAGVSPAQPASPPPPPPPPPAWSRSAAPARPAARQSSSPAGPSAASRHAQRPSPSRPKTPKLAPDAASRRPETRPRPVTAVLRLRPRPASRLWMRGARLRRRTPLLRTFRVRRLRTTAGALSGAFDGVWVGWVETMGGGWMQWVGYSVSRL